LTLPIERRESWISFGYKNPEASRGDGSKAISEQGQGIMTTKPNIFMRSLSALSNVFRRHKVEKPAQLLPKRKPLQAFRPGRQHFQIHDPDYLEKILSAELESQDTNHSSAEESGR
jgi:hypothetical protein